MWRHQNAQFAVAPVEHVFAMITTSKAPISTSNMGCMYQLPREELHNMILARHLPSHCWTGNCWPAHRLVFPGDFFPSQTGYTMLKSDDQVHGLHGICRCPKYHQYQLYVTTCTIFFTKRAFVGDICRIVSVNVGDREWNRCPWHPPPYWRIIYWGNSAPR